MSAIMVFVLFGIFSIFPIEQIFLMTAIIFGFEWYIPRLHDQALWRHSFFSQLVRGYFLLTALMIALVPLACEISKRFLQMFFKSGLDRIDIAQYIIGLLLSLMIGSIQWNAVERRALQLVGYGDLWSIRTSIRADRTSAG